MVKVPAESPILRPGDQVRVAGRLAGFVDAVDPNPDSDVIDVKVNMRPEFAPVGVDARANIKVRSIVYLTYVEIFPGNIEEPAPSGYVIDQELVTSGVDLLEIVQLFDKRARKTLERSVVNAGYGLAGRGPGTNQAIADLEPTLQNTTKQLRAATSKRGAVSDLVAGAAKTTSGLRGSQSDDVQATVESGAAVLGAIANKRTALAAALDQLRPFEDEFLATAPIAQPLLDDAAGLADDLTPAVKAANAALPDLNRLLGLGDEFRTETVAFSILIDPVLRAQRPLLRATYPSAASAPLLLDNLRSISNQINPYAKEISQAGKGLISATSLRYPSGVTAPDNVALRFTPLLGCHTPRNPYPAPGEAATDSQAC